MCQRPKIQKGSWYVFDTRPIISKILNEIVYEEKQVSWFEWQLNDKVSSVQSDNP